MKAAIKRWNQLTEFHFPERCFITELSNSSDDPELSIARARVAPGVTTRRHRLRDTAERYYILSGKGRMEIANQPPQDVTAGDIILIPAMCNQRISNTGGEDLIFLAICTPRFDNESYEDLE